MEFTAASGRSHALGKKFMQFVIGAAALMSGVAPAAFIAASNGVVLDTVTGLEWEQNANHGPFNWADAKAYATGLPLDGGGWRLPEIGELQKLYDELSTLDGCKDCTGTRQGFADIQLFYVSATEAIPGLFALHIIFDSGLQEGSLESTEFSAWAVRPHDVDAPAGLLLFGIGALGLALSRRPARRH